MHSTQTWAANHIYYPTEAAQRTHLEVLGARDAYQHVEGGDVQLAAAGRGTEQGRVAGPHTSSAHWPVHAAAGACNKDRPLTSLPLTAHKSATFTHLGGAARGTRQHLLQHPLVHKIHKQQQPVFCAPTHLRCPSSEGSSTWRSEGWRVREATTAATSASLLMAARKWRD